MNNFQFFPHTDEDIQLMLQKIGVKSLDDLNSDIPAEYRYEGDYDLPDTMSEQEVREFFNSLGRKNTPLKCFVGQGAYDHYTPAVIPYLTQRSEFLTAYTPYQCEISQGTLRYIFEYQTMICNITGMDVSNASMYDGPTAAAEAMRMMIATVRKSDTVLVSKTLLPHVIEVIKTYAKFYGTNIVMIDECDGQTSLESLKRSLTPTLSNREGEQKVSSMGGDLEGATFAGAIIPAVNRYGIIEDLEGFAEEMHAQKALLTVYCDPSAQAILKTPAEWGADIAVGDGQSLGIPLCYGGPYMGFMACCKEHLRKLPGRIVGQTTDKEGHRSFVLTLQAREQHIRREKATSNICSNESLMALWVTVYLSLMGPQGMKKLNEQCYDGAHYLHDELLKSGKFEKVFEKPFLKEFVLKPLVDVKDLQQKLYDAGFFAALQTEEGYVSFCVTEKRTKEEIDALINIIKE
ncbi:MAG: aminomethyl-transferring glycine dehydrogenase subunit GcvPA [Prevotella sp.]|nr:aminomethyl-transferring glycine dehydrogenase subunit GcvPA [Candidatus Equicola stercoris]